MDWHQIVNINGRLSDLLRGNLSTVPHFGSRTKGACFPFLNSLFQAVWSIEKSPFFQAFKELEEKLKKVTEAFIFQYSAKTQRRKFMINIFVCQRVPFPIFQHPFFNLP